jgi:hypothetical protein
MEAASKYILASKQGDKKMIELYLSSDGKHTVHVSTETLEEIVELAPKAKALYDKIVETYGNKAQMWQEAGIVKTHTSALPVEPKRIETPQAAEAPVAPRCPVHDKPMKLRRGAYGTFWSCPTRNPDGRWCAVTKEVDSDGHKKASAQNA